MFASERDVAYRVGSLGQQVLAMSMIASILTGNPIAFATITSIGGVAAFGCVVYASLTTGPSLNPFGDYATFCNNCASWVRKQLKTIGIRIAIPSYVITPSDMVNYLHAHPEAVVLS